jgi:hypothetical protein
MFPVTSRYFGIEVAQIEIVPDHPITYLRRRFIPDNSNVVPLTEHVILQGERLDNITAKYLGDPELFWMLVDASNALRPDDLTDDSRIGQRIIIPLPQGG